MLAQERHSWDDARKWYHQSLSIKERLQDELSAAGIYHQLGTVVQELQDLTAAEQWYKKSLEVTVRLEHRVGLLKLITNSERWLNSRANSQLPRSGIESHFKSVRH